MTVNNRMSPAPAPNNRPRGGASKGPLDRVAEVSRPLQELLRQQGIIGPDGDSGAFYDLMAIHAAAKADPHFEGRRPMTPQRFVADHDHAVSALDRSNPARILVDRHAAFSYVSDMDHRVQIAIGNQMMLNTQAATEVDPIQAGVDSCRGGPFALMIFGGRVMTAMRMSQAEFFAAMIERAKQQAEAMEPIAAESFVDTVRKAIEGCPEIRFVSASDLDGDDD